MSDFLKHPFFINLLLVKMLFTPSFLLGKTLNHNISLAGEWKYAVGDDLMWKEIAFDDHNWKKIKLPGKCPFPYYPCYVWYRKFFRFKMRNGWKNIALFIGSVWYADEVFINGVKIGGEGKVGSDFVEADKKVRLYHIDPNLIYQDRPNLIAIRTYISYVDGGIYGPIIIGDEDMLEKMKIHLEHRQENLELFVLGGIFIIDFFCIFLTLKNKEEKEYLCFTAFMFLYTLIWIFDSLWFYNTGLKDTVIQRLVIFFIMLEPAFIFLFLLMLLKQKISRISELFICLFLFIGILYILFPSAIIIYRFASYFWPLMVMLLLLILIITMIKLLYINYKPEYLPVCLGLLSLISAHLIETAHNLMGMDIITSNKITHIGILMFVATAIYSLNIRYHNMARALRNITSEVLSAQEEERRRISRELHDTIGQKLVELKLKLQLSLQHHSMPYPLKESLINLKDGLGKAVEELRQICSNLRPIFFEYNSLPEAIRWYGDNLGNGKFHITYFLEDIELPLHVCEHLYRIYQEAMINIVRYSDAKNVKLFFFRSKNRIVLRIEDDGKGIDNTGIKINKRKGLGLDTMRERAKMIGGYLNIESFPFKGTKIEVVFPWKEIK